MAKTKVTTSKITVIIRRIIAVLKPSDKINDYINNAKAVSQSISVSGYLPASVLSITLAQFNTNINTLANAEVDLTAVPPTATVAQRNAAKRIVAANLRLLLSDVNKVVENNPENAEDIISSAGFAVKLSTSHGKVSGVKQGKASGSVIITAPEGKPHEWAQLANDGVTWLYLKPTLGGKKTVTDLTTAKLHTFKSAPILKDEDGQGEWTVYPPFMVA